jgi:hypothetical protein
MQSHHKLDQVFDILWNKITQKHSFVDLVFRLVLFHQSLLGLNFVKSMVELSSEERYKYCDPYMFKLIKVLMIADSMSYGFIYDRDNCKPEALKNFLDNSAFMIEDWYK